MAKKKVKIKKVLHKPKVHKAVPPTGHILWPGPALIVAAILLMFGGFYIYDQLHKIIEEPVVSVPITSPDPADPSVGEDPNPNQPQPVVPDDVQPVEPVTPVVKPTPVVPKPHVVVPPKPEPVEPKKKDKCYKIVPPTPNGGPFYNQY